MVNTPKLIRIEINSEPIDWRKLCYHFQKLPMPGGSNYAIEIDRSESQVIKYIEQMVGKNIDAQDFEAAALEHYASTFNLVDYVLCKLEESSSQREKVEWVLNNIKRVAVSKKKMTVAGECSRFLDDFDRSIST